ncbi:MAG TPA: exodeoxyribonuclease III [Bacilli bacterium]|nr:exodeoxyribonuclease III [Bacilli bacterium]
MKIVSWNVAGFRACLKKGFIDFFNEINADAICLQEVKATKEQIDFMADGYFEYINPAERKGYSGTLIYSKIKPLSVSYGMNNSYNDEGRIITLEYEKYYLINTYVPNVKPDLSRMEYRMNWEEEFLKYLKKLEKNKPVIVCGDLNVAHEEIDIRNAKSNIGHAGFTYEERDKFTKLLSNGFIDTFRFLYPSKEDAYTWWTYIGNARSRNVGWRLDYFVISESLKNKVIDAFIYNQYYGSDHCPIGLEIK